jgi:hypothetical protein
MTLEQILNDEETKEQFRFESGQNLTEKELDIAFKKEIKRLSNDSGKHHWDCKCLICA